jgi:hypothetical protein
MSMIQTKKHVIVAEVQKESKLREEKEALLYFSDIEERQNAAIDRHNRFKQDQYLKKKMQNELLLQTVVQNLKERKNNEIKKDYSLPADKC